MAAVHQVVDTIELLEMILLALPMKDLLFAQTISKHFKAVIENSVKLQQALFFRPTSTSAIIIPKGTNEAPDPVAATIIRNPLLNDLIRVFAALDWDFFETMTQEMNRLGMHKSWLEPHASYRRMLPTQPPVEDIFRVKQIVCFPGRGGVLGEETDTQRYGRTVGQIIACMNVDIPRLARRSESGESRSAYITWHIARQIFGLRRDLRVHIGAERLWLRSVCP